VNRLVIWGIARRYLQALEMGETAAAFKEFLATDVVFRGIPEPAGASRQEARPGCGPGGDGTGQKGHVPADV